MKKVLRTKSSCVRLSIMREIVPEYLAAAKRSHETKKARVLVKTIADLEDYCVYIDRLSKKYANYYGHKKAISELLGVSTNRIGEWQRIWQAANEEYSDVKIVAEVNKKKDSSLVNLIDALRSSGWCPNKKSIGNLSIDMSAHNSALKKRALEKELKDGERSVADPKGRLDFLNSALQQKKLDVDEDIELACFLSSIEDSPQLLKRTRISLSDASERFSNFEQLSPFELHFC